MNRPALVTANEMNVPQLSLLLVDDQPENLLALEAVLADLGHRLVRAGSGREALRRLLEADFALILLDIQMPEMDGFETAQLIRGRERSQATPIIFLTATMRTDEMVFKGYASGAVDYLVKPIVPDILRAKVQVFAELAAARNKILKLNTTLQHHATRLEAANRELESFSYTISHDLRAPLRHINAFIELLETHLGEKLDEKSARHFQIIAESAKTMDQLVSGLLEFSRMSRAPVRKRSVQLAPLIRDLCEVLEPTAGGRQIDWKFGELPEVQADPVLLRLVWQNLLSNALKYTRHSSPAVIEIGCSVSCADAVRAPDLALSDTEGSAEKSGDQPTDELVIYVRDNGAGFNMEQADKLFGVFQRLHSKDQFEGIGIGLATVRRIISRHGGRTWAEGKVGAGATFYFSLPIKSES